jgi:hypothetical protein
MQPDSDYLRSVALGFRLSQVLVVFAELKVADVLDGRQVPIGELSEKVGADRLSLLRIMRVARSLGLVEEVADEVFALTARGQLLRPDVDGTVYPRVRSVGESWQWSSWGRLLQTVVTGRSAFETEHGMNSFDYFDRAPEAGETMMNRVTDEARQRGAAIAQIYDFTPVRCLVDVGGGRGAVLAEVLSRVAGLRGILLDLPYAVAGAEDLMVRHGVADRSEIVAGDFRGELPAGGDLYLLSAVLHSWTDDDSVELLRRCFTRCDRVIVLDEVIDPADAPLTAQLKDLQLMVFSGGRHRGLPEYRQLFERAGGTLVRHTPVGKQEQLMEVHREGSRWP